MNFLLRLFSSVVIVSRRLAAQWGLALVTLIGLIVSISMILSIPLYSDAVYYRTYLGKVSQLGTENDREPFSFVFAYVGSWHGNKQWEDLLPIDNYLSTAIESALDLPLKSVQRYIETRSGELFPGGMSGSGFSDPAQRLDTVSFGTLAGLEDHIRILAGAFPVPGPADGTLGTVEVLASLALANELGLQPGETYIVLMQGQTEAGRAVRVEYPVRLAGIWEPLDASEPYWIFNPSMLNNILLAPEEIFANQISPFLPDEIYSAMWHLVMDGSQVRSSDVGGLLGRIRRFQIQGNTLLPNIETLYSPVDALQAYQRAARLLTILLYAFAVPVMGLVLAFIGLVSNLSIERKQNEIAVTRSRGAAKTQIVSSIALEGLLLGGLALLISLPAALGVTRLMSAPVGWQELSRAFQQGLAGVGDWMRQALGSQPGLQLASIWNSATLRTGVVAVVINLIAMILPALGAARYTIVSYKRERARSLRPPWWQRAWLDVLLFLVAAYGAYQLTQQGSMVALMVTPTGQVGLSSPMSNPLLFLVPSLIVFAFSLFLLRFVPALMALLAWLFSFTRSVGLVLATRHLSRSPATYRTPLIILVFTLSLSAYTASLARTLDHHLVSQTYYQVGADMKFLELGDSPEQSPMGLGPQPTTDTSMQFVFLPVSEYLKIEGIQQVSRVGRFPAAFRSASSGIIAGTFFGIDRTDFPGVAFWRADFAAESLGALMNRLALTPNGVLVPQSFLSQHQLKVGDSISLAVDLFQQDTPVDLTIVGVFDLFPTWYPESGPLFVGNLDYFFTMAGGEFPYHVWMKLDPKADPDQIASEGLKSIDLKVITWEASQPKIDASQNQPERQGVLGLLTLGFVASSILTVLSFLLYALFSYQRRFIELGVMRANGLSLAQMATYMAIELGFLIGLGGAMGTGFGVWTSHFFIPFLQIGADAVSRIPPFQIFIDWTLILQIYGFFAALFVITLVLLVILLLRMKIFQAVKMGEVI